MHPDRLLLFFPPQQVPSEKVTSSNIENELISLTIGNFHTFKGTAETDASAARKNRNRTAGQFETSKNSRWSLFKALRKKNEKQSRFVHLRHFAHLKRASK